MPPRIFDHRDDPSGTIIAEPEMRARFLTRQPGEDLGGFHSHVESGGVETWVILSGAAKFDFDDGSVVARAGQAVVALPTERHRVTCHGHEPVTYFLVVAPHREPTHTYYDAQGNQMPPRPSSGRYTWAGGPPLTK